MNKLSNEEVNSRIQDLTNGWKFSNDIELAKIFKFNNYIEALDFTNRISNYAILLKHYPEIILSHDKVRVSIVTKKVQGITNKDFLLARKIDGLKLDKESIEIYKHIETLKNGTDYNRRKAATRLGKIGDIRAITPLIKALNDKDPFVRRLSAISLGKIKHQRVLIPLINRLDDDEGDLSYAVRDALINIGKPAVNKLIQKINDKNHIIRRRSVMALGKIRDKESIKKFKGLLNDEDEGVRWRVAKYIYISWDDEVVDKLKKMEKKDRSKKVREAAAFSLSKINKEVKNLLPIFEKGIEAISDSIKTKESINIIHYYTGNKLFMDLMTYNPYKNRIYLYKGTGKIKGVKPMKNNNWGIITFQNKEELSLSLEASKMSYILKTEELK